MARMARLNSVQYHELPALLLNEIQKQHKILERQESDLENAFKTLDVQRREIVALKLHVTALENVLGASQPSVANSRR